MSRGQTLLTLIQSRERLLKIKENNSKEFTYKTPDMYSDEEYFDSKRNNNENEVLKLIKRKIDNL